MEPAETCIQIVRYLRRILTKIFTFSTDLHNTQDQISRNSVKWEKLWYTRTDRRRDRHRNRQKERQTDGQLDRWTWRNFWLTYWVKGRVVTSPEINAANKITSREYAYPSVPQNNRHARWPNSQKLAKTILPLTMSNVLPHNCQQLMIKKRVGWTAKDLAARNLGS